MSWLIAKLFKFKIEAYNKIDFIKQKILKNLATWDTCS